MPRASSRRSRIAASRSCAALSRSSPAACGSRSRRARRAQGEGEGDELLLGAVVEVALDAPPRRVGALDDPRPRGAQLLHVGAQLGVEALVLQRQRGRAAHRAHELGLVGDRRRVDQQRDRAAALIDRRADPARARGRRREGIAALVDPLRALGQPVRQLQRRVAEGVGERGAQRAAAAGAEARDEVADGRGRGHSAAQQAGEEGEGHHGQRDDPCALEVVLRVGPRLEDARGRSIRRR
jgi:hypothetical protein